MMGNLISPNYGMCFFPQHNLVDYIQQIKKDKEMQQKKKRKFNLLAEKYVVNKQ